MLTVFGHQPQKGEEGRKDLAENQSADWGNKFHVAGCNLHIPAVNIGLTFNITYLFISLQNLIM